MRKPVAVVGAGLAGLVCARRLDQAGVDVLLFESASRPGGRLRTDVVDGFRLDYGFPYYLDAAPHARLELDHSKLDLKPFEPGVKVFDGRCMRDVHPEAILETIFSRWVPMSDLLRINQLDEELRTYSESDIAHLPDQTVEDFLRTRRFSSAAIERYFRPYYGSLLLDPDLSQSSQNFVRLFRQLHLGRACIPARGIEEIPRQIADGINPDRIRLNTRVTRLRRAGELVQAVELETGEVIEVDHVVVATEQAEASRLTDAGSVRKAQAMTVIHFATPEPLGHEPILHTNAVNHGDVNYVVCKSSVSRSLAPSGQHLVTAVALGSLGGTDHYIAGNARYQLRAWFPNQKVDSWRPLRVDHVAAAQMNRPVGFAHHMLPIQSGENLFLAGEYLTHGGIDGAVLSGQNAANLVLQEYPELLRA